MSGIKIIRSLLVGNASLVAAVPSDNIVAGVLQTSTAMPAIAITEVSGFDDNILKAGPTHHVTELIQVTAVAQSYPQLKSIMALIRSACRDRIGTFIGISGVTVHTASKGPDFNFDDAGLYAQSQDFRVGFEERA